jgi:CRP-like cAMP-binding protein
VGLLSGRLLASLKIADSQEEVRMFDVHPREIVGELAVLTAERSFLSIIAECESRIAVLPKDTFYR